MQKFNKAYFVFGIVWTALLAVAASMSGEVAELILLATIYLTVPLGILLEPLYTWLIASFQLSGYGFFVDFFFVPLTLVLNYFQWRLFIGLFQNIWRKKNLPKGQ